MVRLPGSASGVVAVDSTLAGAAAAAGVAGPGVSPPVTSAVVTSGGWSARSAAWAATPSGVVPGVRLGV